MVFDSHFHLPSMVSRGLSPSLPSPFLGLECGTEPGDIGERIRLLGGRKDVRVSIGAGPWCLDKPSWKGTEDAILSLRRDYLEHGADAIGECGFDNHWGYGTKKEQMDLFMAQLELSEELGLPLIIHSRDADRELEEVLPYLGGRTIMHCFSSSPAMAEKLLERGAYLSFAGNVTYRSNKDIQESARLCPLDRILYETDAPYLTPVPLRGKPNTPEYTEHTLSFLAALRNEERNVIKENAARNFLSLMKNSESEAR